MRALITGASGFLGRHLSERLQSEGHEVHLLTSKNAPFLEARYLVDFERIKFDRIYHCAVLTRAGDFCQKSAGEQWLTNQKIDTNILEWWSRKQTQARFIAFGTSVSYAAGSSLNEDVYMAGEPIAAYYGYAMSKRMLLTGLRALRSQFGLKYNYVIPSTLYGAGYHTDGRTRHFIYDIIAKALAAKRANSSIELFGDGTTQRELLHMRDFLTGLEKIVSQTENEIFNLGSGQAHSIREFGQMICDQIHYDFANVKFNVAKGTGLPSKILDVSKVRALGFKPQVPLAEGVRETIEWCERGV